MDKNEARELEEWGCDVADDIREGLRASKHGRLKTILWDTKNTLLGVLAGGIGRLTGYPGLIAIPPAVDIFAGKFPTHSGRAIKRKLFSYAEYAFGAALPYADVIYELISDKF